MRTDRGIQKRAAKDAVGGHMKKKTADTGLKDGGGGTPWNNDPKPSGQSTQQKKFAFI